MPVRLDFVLHRYPHCSANEFGAWHVQTDFMELKQVTIGEFTFKIAYMFYTGHQSSFTRSQYHPTFP